MERNLIAFMNSYTQGISGGDACFIETAKRINQYNKIVVTSLLGKRLCESKGLNANYLITTGEEHFQKVILTYIKRIFKALLLKTDISEGDILYSTSDFFPDVIPAFVRKLRKRKVKWVQKIFHLIPPDRPIPHYAQKFSFFLTKQFADLVIVDNCLLKKDLIQQGFNIDKLTVIPPGIDIKYFKNVKHTEGINYDGVFLGRLHLSKGIFDLVEIWKLVCEKKPNAKLAIIGEGDAQIKKELKEKIKGNNLKHNIDILGYLEDDVAFGIIKSSKVFVFPSHEEGFGIAILEAMACGLPVVAWDLPVYRAVFPKGMIMVPMGNTKEFAETILNLLDNRQLYESVSRQTEEVSERYGWDKIAKRELESIENLIKEEE